MLAARDIQPSVFGGGDTAIRFMHHGETLVDGGHVIGDLPGSVRRPIVDADGFEVGEALVPYRLQA